MSLAPVIVIARIPNASPSERIYVHVYFSKSSNVETFSGVPIAKAKDNGIYAFRINVSPFVPFAIKLQRWSTVKVEDRPTPSASPSPSSSLTPECSSRAAAGDGKKESITVLEWQGRRIVVEKSWTVIFIEWDQPTRKLMLLNAGDPKYLFAGKYPVQKFPLETNFFVRSSICNWNAGPRMSEVHEFPSGSGIFWSWLFGSLNSVNEYKMVATIGGNAFGNRTIVVWEPLPFKNKTLRPNIPDTFYLLFSDWGDYTDEYKAVDMKKSIIYDSHDEAVNSVGCARQDGANPVSIWQRYLLQLAASSSAQTSAPMQTSASQASLVTVESATAEGDENEVVFCSSCKAQDLREELERLTRTMEGPGAEVGDPGCRRLLMGGQAEASCPSGECSASVISKSKDDNQLGEDEFKAQPLGSGVTDDFGASNRAADAEMESEEMDFVLEEAVEYELLGDPSYDAINSENFASVEDISVSENVDPDPVQEIPKTISKLENRTEETCQDVGILSECKEKLNLNSLTKDLHSKCLVQDISATVPVISEPFANNLKNDDELKLLTPQELEELSDEFASATDGVEMSESEMMQIAKKLTDKIIEKRNSEVKLQEFDRDDNDDECEYEDDDDYDKPYRRFETYYNRLKTIEEEADNLDESASPARCGYRCSALQRSFLTDTNTQKKEDTKRTPDDENDGEFVLEGPDYDAMALPGDCVETGKVQNVVDAESGEEIACDVDDCSPYAAPATPDRLSSSELRAVQTVMERYPCDERSFKAYKYFLRRSQTETDSYRQCIDRSLLRDIIPFFATGDDDDDDDDICGSCSPGQFDRFAGAGGDIDGPFDSQQEPPELRGVTEMQVKCFKQGVELYPTDKTTVCSEELAEAEYEAETGRVKGQLSGDLDTDISAELDYPTTYATCEQAEALEMDASNNSRAVVMSARLLLRANSGDRFALRGEDIDRLDGVKEVKEVKVFRPCVFFSNRFVGQGQEPAFCPSPPPPDYAQFETSGDPDDSCHVTNGGGKGVSWGGRENKMDDDDDYAISSAKSPVDLAVFDSLTLGSACDDTPRSPVHDGTYDESFETCRSEISQPDQVDREEILRKKERFFRVPKCVLKGIVNYESDYDSDTASKFPTEDGPDSIRMSTRLGLKKHVCYDDSRQFPDDFASVGQKFVDRNTDDLILCHREAGCYGAEDRCPAAFATGDAWTVGSQVQCGKSAPVCPDSSSLMEKCGPVMGIKSLETDQCYQELYGAGCCCDKDNPAPFEDDWCVDESEDKTDQSGDKIRAEFRRRRLEEIFARDSKFREILERKNLEFSFNQSMDYMLDFGDEEIEKSDEEEREDEGKLDVRNFAIFPTDTMDFVLEDFDEDTGNKKDVDLSVETRTDPGSTVGFQYGDYMNRPPSPFAEDWYEDPGRNSFTAFLEKNSSAVLEDLVRKRTAILEHYHDSVLAGTSAISRRVSVYTAVPGQEELELPSESTFLRGTSSGDQIKVPCEGSCEPMPCGDLGNLEKAEISESPEMETCSGVNASSAVMTLQGSVSGMCEPECIQNMPDVSDSLPDVLMDDGGHSSEEGDIKTDSSTHLSVESSKATCEQQYPDISRDAVSDGSRCSEDSDPCPILVPVSTGSDLCCQFANIEISSDDRRSTVSMLNSEEVSGLDANEEHGLAASDATAGFLVEAAICKAQDNIHAKVESTAENQVHDCDETSGMENLVKEEADNTKTKNQTVYFS